MKKPKDRGAAVREGIMRHVVGATRVNTKRAAKAADRATPAKPAAVAAVAPERKPLKISDAVLDRARMMSHRLDRKKPRTVEPGAMFQPFEPAPGVMPKGVQPLAMDEALNGGFAQLMNWGSEGQLFEEGIGFLGYAYLAQLTQRPEYRRISERIGTEMTRRWIKLHVVSKVEEATEDPPPAEPGAPPPGAGTDPLSDQDGAEGPEQAKAERDRVRDSVAAKESAKKAKRIKELEDELRKFKVKDHFYNIAEGDGWFGRYHLYVDLKKVNDLGMETNEGLAELKTTIGNGRNSASKAKVRKGQIAGFRPVEPMWCYPATYEARNPLKPEFYNPERWYANGIEIHRSRLLCFVGREVPDILKPAYAFGGLSMSQMAKPYVDNWLRTRQAVADLIESFSVSGVYTNMQAALQDGGVEALKRIDLFNTMRSNAGAFALDKESEEFFNVSTPLGTLDALQAQSQEQMSSVSGIPLIILLGITPQGLNASSEGEIRAFYDWIHAFQESFFRDHLQTVIEFVMLHLWGEVDEEITFEFEPLWSMTDKEVAEIDKLEAETDQVRIDSGVLDPAEVRKAVAAKPESRYSDINPEDMPEPPEQPDMGDGGGDGGSGGNESRSPGGGGGKGPADKAFDGALDGAIAFLERVPGETRAEFDARRAQWIEETTIAFDAFNEADHPRGQPGNAGQFGSGGGGSSPKSSKAGSKASSESSPKPSPYKTAGKPSWNGGTLADPAEMDTGTIESNARALRHAIKSSPFTHAQRAKREERLADLDAELKERASKPAAGGNLDMSKLKKQGGKLGSNSGGTYTNDAGEKFYIKNPPSKAHVENEKTAARLYQLAGANTLKYRDVDGGEHVATEWQGLDKNNIAKFTPAEKKEAAKDFAVHAWLSNWDAAGLGGDNQGIMGGKPTTLDVGGSLRYRAQGGEKGKAFGPKVTELETLRDKSMNPDAAGLFGSMSDADVKASIERVTSIPDDKIRSAVGDDKDLADTLIARKNDMAKRLGAIAQDEAMMLAALDAAIEDDEELTGDAAMMAAALDAVEVDEEDDTDDLDSDGVEELAPGVYAMDEEPFDPAKHPKDEKGQFTETGGGVSPGAGETAAKLFKSKKEHIAHLLTEGTTPKELMVAMGWPSVSMPAQAKSLGMKLEKKDGKYFGTKMTAEELAAAKEADQDKATQKAMSKTPVAETLPGSPSGQKKQSLEDMAGQPAPKLGTTPSDIPKGPKPGEPPQNYSEFLGALAEAAQTKDVHSVVGLIKFNEEWAKQFLKSATPAGKAALEKVVPGIFAEHEKPKAPSATADELKKAAKSTTLPISSTSPGAVAIIKDFNDKYAGKDNLSKEQLNQKVQDFKDLKVMTAKADQEYAAQSAAEKKALEKKAIEEAKKKAADKLANEKAEMQAKFDADPELQVHYEAMEALFGGANAGSQYLLNAGKKVKSAGLSKHLSPEDAVPIIAYSGSHYGDVNQQLREGKMTKPQFLFMKSLNAGLDKLPSYTQTTYRKASVPPDLLNLYQPGHIVEERGFTSSSKNQGTWSGSHTFTIHGKSGKDIQKLSSHPSEAEVLFKSGTRFEVISRTGTHIEMREV